MNYGPACVNGHILGSNVWHPVAPSVWQLSVVPDPAVPTPHAKAPREVGVS